MKRNSRITDDTTRRDLTDKARRLERRALVLDTIAEGKDDDPLPILDGEDMDAALDACVALTLGKQPPSGKALRRDAAEIRRLTEEEDNEPKRVIVTDFEGPADYKVGELQAGIDKLAPKPKKRHTLARGNSYAKIAARFNAKAVPLIRAVNGNERIAIPERKRGGGYYLEGKLTERTLKSWVKKYPDQYKPEPRCGFHAGLLDDPPALDKCVERWGKYALDYAKQYLAWRLIHKHAKRGDFRYEPNVVAITETPTDFRDKLD